MKHLNWKLIALCVAAFALSAAVAWGIYGSMPHIEDEQANVFQAKVFASGNLAVHAPSVQPNSFYLPFVLNQNGWLFGKYPPGYSLILAPAAWIDQWWLINALAAVVVVLGVYLLGRDLFDANTGLLAAALGLLAPMFILLSGALVSHLVTMALLMIFTWGFVRARRSDRGHPIGFAALAGIMIGLAFITRPWTTFAIGLPFAAQALIDLIRRWRLVWRAYVVMLIIFSTIAIILPLYNAALTGSPFTNTYALWWSMDRLGFGPGIGTAPGGHSLYTAIVNFRLDFPIFGQMLSGWPNVVGISLVWLPLIAGLLLPPLTKRDWALMLPPIMLVGAHFLYWARGSSFYGPRYYAEAMPFLWLVIARGLIKICAIKNPWPRRMVYVALPLLVAFNIVYVIEPHFITGFAQYRSARRAINTIAQADVHHALIFVRAQQWQDYAAVGWLNAPDLVNGDLIFAYDFGPSGNAHVIQAFPDRAVYYFDRSQPYPLVAGRSDR
ncbi:MAG TPA: glycosyltransferase family 39 protein [Anaerolineae bacterium]|nr:glycosyltransferase family 39 protein [Anaerolineae bacterium]